jgi:hypothetical protein
MQTSRVRSVGENKYVKLYIRKGQYVVTSKVGLEKETRDIFIS